MAADGKDVFAIDIAAGLDAQLAQDAAVEVEQDVGVAGVDRAVRVELLEVRAFHAHLVGRGLQQAVATFLATRAEVIAFDEQHLQQGLAVAVEFFGIAFDLQPGAGAHAAGSPGVAIDFHAAQPARPMGREIRVPAQVRDVAMRTRGGLQQGLAGAKRHIFTIQQKARRRARFIRHVRFSRCAPASSRPVMRRAIESSASRSKPGSKCSDFRCCS